MLAPLATSLVQPVISSIVKDINGRGVRGAGRGSISRLLIITNMNLDLMAFFQETIYLTIKDGAYVINLDDKNSKETHRVSLFIDIILVVYFDFFAIKYIPLQVLNKIKDKSITHNIFRIKDNESIMCGFYW